MCYKLSVLGFSSKIINVIAKLYQNNSYQVWDGSSLSDPFPVTQGLRQGCPLSPILFALYINDLIDFLPGGVNVSGTTVKALM